MKKYIILLLVSCVWVVKSQAQSPQKISYAYDDLSRLSTVTYPNGTQIVYTYDALGNRQTQVVSTTSCTAPTAPTISSTTISSGQTATLTATGCAGSVAWFTASLGGASIATGASFTTPTLTATTTYYASCIINTCESTTRSSGTVTVNAACTPPAAPVVSGFTLSSALPVTINQTAACVGGTVKWYDAPTGGNLLNTGGIYSTIDPIYSTTNYYLSCTVNNCESTRSQYTVNYDLFRCYGGQILSGTYGNINVQVSGTIASTSTISAGARTNFFAGQSIMLNPGFKTSNGSTFRAEIQNCVSNTGLVGYYPFNGNAKDESGSLNHGTASGATLGVDRFGYSNTAYGFNGTSNSINTSLTQNNVSSYSISAWVKTDLIQAAGNSAPVIQTRGPIGQGGKSVSLGYDKSLGKWFIAMDADYIIVGTSLTMNNTNQWMHITGTWSGTAGSVISPSQFKLYVNGVLQTTTAYGSNSTIVAPISGSGTSKIGYSEAWNGYFQGQIDNIRIYNRALSNTEVLGVYNFEKR